MADIGDPVREVTFEPIGPITVPVPEREPDLVPA